MSLSPLTVMKVSWLAGLEQVRLTFGFKVRMSWVSTPQLRIFNVDSLGRMCTWSSCSSVVFFSNWNLERDSPLGTNKEWSLTMADNRGKNDKVRNTLIKDHVIEPVQRHMNVIVGKLQIGFVQFEIREHDRVTQKICGVEVVAFGVVAVEKILHDDSLHSSHQGTRGRFEVQTVQVLQRPAAVKKRIHSTDQVMRNSQVLVDDVDRGGANCDGLGLHNDIVVDHERVLVQSAHFQSLAVVLGPKFLGRAVPSGDQGGV
ncbi:hypothetical protein WICPIJ_008087 [Wickerhamomyces pijperi]|uniref:Uncharacterized protein n=1 Tax=Wickerhamomyces pijperi TaxID=599730 RepID=A0A9P8Q117_WICPI|nr:hypothetical protein WICPIJ_008087 [Wickerhamomyces pijperi]